MGLMEIFLTQLKILIIQIILKVGYEGVIFYEKSLKLGIMGKKDLLLKYLKI